MAHRKTLSDLRTAVRNNLDESSAQFWTNSQLLTYLNRAKDRAVNEVRKLKDDFFMVQRASTDGSLTILGETYAASSFQIVAGTRNYTLPPDFLEMRLVEVITSGYETVRFIFRDIADPLHRAEREITDQQTPQQFFFDIFDERTMCIAPLSNTTLDLRLSYIPFIADLSDDADELEMPHPLYMAVEAFATSAALKQDRDFQAAAVWEQTGRAVIADVFGAHGRQSQDPEFVQSALQEWMGW